MEFVNLNGQIFKKEDAAIKVHDSFYRTDDGLFETMKVVDDKIFLEQFHFERLFSGLDLLKFHIPGFFFKEKLIEEISALCEANQFRKLTRVRLSVSRNGDGQLNYLIECWPLQLREENLVIDIFPDARKSCDIFSNIKSINRLPYVMAEKIAKGNHLDDALVLNEYGRICDSTIANLFWIKDENIFTPPLSEGCVAGVMRRRLIQDTEYRIQEKVCEISDLQNADEIFLTNVIRGIRKVKRFASFELKDQLTKKIEQQLNI